MSVTLYLGNTSPPLYYRFRVPVEGSSATEPYPLPSGAVVRFSMKKVGEAGYVVDHQLATIVNPAAVLPTDTDAGRVRFDFLPAYVDEADEFVGWFSVTFPGGAVQDAPQFTITITEPGALLAGSIISVAGLKDFTGLDALKSADDEWLAAAIIPRAEAWISGLGPFTSLTCPGLVLATNILAEYLFLKHNPQAVNASASGEFKSESIGSYSYSIGDTASANLAAWEDLWNELTTLVASCQVAEAGSAHGVAWGSGAGGVFTPLPSVIVEEGELLQTFDVAEEVAIIRRWRGTGSWWW